MNIIRYCFILFVLFFSINTFSAQNGKKQKSPMPANSINPAAYSNITANLYKFMNKVGVSPSSAKLYPVSSKIAVPAAVGSFQKLYLPGTQNLNNTSLSRVILDKDFGTPRLIDVQLPAKKANSVQSNGVPTVAAMHFLVNNKSLLKISDPAKEFSLQSSKNDDYGVSHLRYQQVYKGIEVWGKDIYVHLNKQGSVLSLTGRYAPTPMLLTDINGKLSSSAAISGAVNDLQKRNSIINLSNQFEKLLNYSGPSANRVIWHDKNQQPHLAWHVEVRSGLSQDWYYFIDANSGTILNAYNNVCYDGATTASGKDLNGVTRTFGTYSVGGTYYMLDAAEPMFNATQSKLPDNPVGAIMCLDLRNSDLSTNSQYYYESSTNNQWTDPSGVSANYNAYVTYQYYRNIHKRNSIDDKGMTIFSIIHATENSQSMANAFWSGQVMCYGDGGSIFKPLAGGLDVAAHEMTHGVTQNTSNLEYQDQSGALNESMSDVFGKLVDTTSWRIGPDIIRDLQTFPSGALRDMRDPHNGGTSDQDACWQPATLSEYVTTTSDNGGVHVNSGIPNHAFYYVASYIGRSSAGKIWYQAETSYLTHTSQFVDERIATEKAATELFGANSNELTAVQKAWDNVGVTENTPTPTPPPSELTGANWILAVNTDPTDLNSLYMSTPSTTNPEFHPLSRTAFHSKPAVTDTSGFILFVDANYNLRAIYANPNSPQEQVLDSHGIWGSVAIGPGLNSFAITTHYIDTTIYYFDLVDTLNNRAFKIKTPAYDASNTSTALYADEMSFDPTGRFLLFDSQNLMRGISGEISFWTINLLDVHSGNMETVFPVQPEGIDVGDPSFSKTTQTRFTFDYLNTNTNKYTVMAADFNTGTVAVVDSLTSFDLGYPTYSGDDKTIAYHTKSVQNGIIQDAIQQMPLHSDFITGSGAPQQYLVGATYPVWFVIGSRITTDVKTNPAALPKTTALEQNYPNPFNPSTIISWQLASAGKVSMKIYDILGNEVSTLVDEYQNAGQHSVSFNPISAGSKRLSSGIYFYQLKAGNYIQTRKMILLK